MKARFRNAALVLAMLLPVSVPRGASAQGVPEPGIVLYGKVWNDGVLVTDGRLTWTYVGQRRETVQVDTALEALATSDGDTFSYRIVIPAEMPVAGVSLSPNVLEVTEASTTYARAAVIDGTAVVLAGDRDADTFSVDERGKLERVDLALSGSVVPTYDCGGMVTYGGHQPGEVVVQAYTHPDCPGVPERECSPGDNLTVAYAFAGLPAGDYYLRAFRDTDGNGFPDWFEAQGLHALNPVRLPPDVGTADIVLSDPDTDHDRLPDWWEMLHFNGLGQLADDDPDKDGRTNEDEYDLACDPLNDENVCELQLYTGWNLVSLSVVPDAAEPDAVFPRALVFHPVWEWLDQYIPAAEIVPKAGYWLCRRAHLGRVGEEPHVLQVHGEWVADRMCHLRGGWNMLGPVFECARPTHPDILGPVWLWDAEAAVYAPVGEGETLKTGCAYWVFAAKNCDIEL